MGDKSFTGFIGILAIVSVFLPWVNISSSSRLETKEGVIDSAFNFSHGINGIQDMMGIVCLCLLIIGLIAYLNHSKLSIIPVVLALVLGLSISLGIVELGKMDLSFDFNNEYGSLSNRSSFKSGYGLKLFNLFSFLFIIFISLYFSGDKKSVDEKLTDDVGGNVTKDKRELLEKLQSFHEKDVVDENTYRRLKNDVEANF